MKIVYLRNRLAKIVMDVSLQYILLDMELISLV